MTLLTDSPPQHRSYASALLNRSLKQQTVLADQVTHEEKTTSISKDETARCCYGIDSIAADSTDNDSYSWCSTSPHSPTSSRCESESEEKEDTIDSHSEAEEESIVFSTEEYIEFAHEFEPYYDEEEYEEDEVEERSNELDEEDYKFQLHCAAKYPRTGIRRRSSSSLHSHNLRSATVRRDLRIACFKTAPNVPSITERSHTRSRLARLVQRPMSEEETKKRKVVHAKKSEQQPCTFTKAQIRTVAQRTRNLPVSILKCSNKRWMKILQHRLIKKQITRERISRKQTHSMKLELARRTKDAARAIHCCGGSVVTLPSRITPASRSFGPAWMAEWKLVERKKHEKAQQNVADALNSKSKTSSRPPPPLELSEGELLHEYIQFRRRFYRENRHLMMNSLLPQHKYWYCDYIAALEPNRDVILEFMRLLSRLTPRVRRDATCLSYHGTPACNIRPILNFGFKIPGRSYANTTSISIANGSVMGKGVYTSTDIGVSLSYGKHDTILVCAVVTAQLRQVENPTHLDRPPNYSGSVIVLYQESRVLPCYLLKVGSGVPPNDHRINIRDNQAYELRVEKDYDVPKEGEEEKAKRMKEQTHRMKPLLREVLKKYHATNLKGLRHTKMIL